MSLADQLRKLRLEHPDWRLAQAARSLGYNATHVARVARQNGIEFPTTGPYGARGAAPEPEPAVSDRAAALAADISLKDVEEALYKLADTEGFRMVLAKALAANGYGAVTSVLYRDNAAVIVKALDERSRSKAGSLDRALLRLQLMTGADGEDAWRVFREWLGPAGRRAFAEWMRDALKKLDEDVMEKSA